MLHATKIFILIAAFLIVALPSAGAFADEPTFLERLSVETTELAKRARRATVRVSATGVSCEAVLVGSPPRLVTTFVPIGVHEEVRFVLWNGGSGKARRIAGERELDIAVYELPEGAAPGAATLMPEARWALPPGRISVLGGNRPRLLLASNTRGLRDGVRVAEDGASGVLLAADGNLLGFRPAVTRAPGYYVMTGTAPGRYVVTGSRPGEVWLDATTRYWRKRVTTDWDGVYRFLWSNDEEDRADTVRVPAEEGNPSDGVELDVTPTVSSVSLVSPIRQAVSVLTPNTFLPGALIHRVLEDLTTHGKVRHAHLGVVPAAPKEGRGAMLVTVLPGSPAARAGLEAGEIITSVDGEPIQNAAELTRQIVLRQPGEVIRFIVRGHAHLVLVTLGEQAEARRGLPSPDALGFEVVPLTPELRHWLGLKDAERGVAVRAVEENSPAAKAGLKRGDVILKGGDQPSRDVEELLAALAGADGQIVLTVRRVGSKSRLLLALRLPTPEAPAESR